MKLAWIVILLGALAFTPNLHALTLIAEVNTQATSRSCQSYAFAILLSLEESKYGETALSLHNTEVQIRKLVEKHGGQSGSHDAWTKAVSEFTKGKYALKIDYKKSGVDWVSSVRKFTTPSIDEIQSLQLTKAVATSVVSIDGSQYDSGHVIVVSNIDNSVAANKIVYLNGGIKPESDSEFSDHICRQNSLGREKYVVGIRETDNFALKDFGKGAGIYRILKME